MHVPEDVVSLAFEVVLHKDVLAPTVPQIQLEAPEKPQITVLHVVGWVQSARFASEVVRENNRPDGGLASTRAAHQEHLRLGGLRRRTGLKGRHARVTLHVGLTIPNPIGISGR